MKLRKINNFDKFEVHGTLLLSEIEIEGVLKSDGNNYKLSFNTEHVLEINESINECEFTTVKGETLFLINGVQSGQNRNFPGRSEFEYLFTQIWLSSSHTYIPNSFDSVKVKFSGLKKNIKNSPFNIKINSDETEYTISINTDNLKKKIATLDDITLYSLCNTKRSITRSGESNFQYENMLQLKYNTDTNSDKCISDALNLSYIFSLITNEKHKIENIILSSNSDNYRVFLDLPFDFKEYHKTSITYITSDFLKQYSPKIFSFFYSNQNLLEDIFSGYIKLMYSTKFINHYLVDLLKLNEGLHRRFISNKKTNLVDRYKELLRFLDDDLQIYLKNVVNYDESLHNFLKDFRHYHSHYYPIEKKTKYTNDSIFNVSKYVLQLHKAFILTKIGIPSKDIITLLKNTH